MATIRKWLRRLLMVVAVLVDVIGVLAIGLYVSTENLSQFGATPGGARLERMKDSPNFDGKVFKNPVPTRLSFGGSTFKMLGRWLFGDEQRRPDIDIPVVALDRNSFDTPPAEGLRVTWLGHSTILIEIDGQRILTDPVWSKRCSPSSIVGPARFHPVPLALQDLPRLDAVVISHDHFDHLDKHAVIALAKTGVRFFIPLGVGAHLERWGIDPSQIAEHDWGDSTRSESGELELVATPARHFSGRATSMNRTLWASWVIIGPKHRVYFSGDTGPFSGFEVIGQAYGPFDITFMKIGAYDRLWPKVHLNPEQAVDAHQALRGKLLMPIHWGTFNLAFHDWNEPPERLLAAAGSGQVVTVIPRPGQMILPKVPPEVQRWWRKAD